MPKTTGLYKNGRFWWVRVRVPGQPPVPRSTGTENVKLASSIRNMVESMRHERGTLDLLRLAASGKIPLPDLYDYYATGTLGTLREKLDAAGTDDPDVEPWVAKWDAEHLAIKGLNANTRADYVRHVRALLPAGVKVRRSALTEDAVKAALLALRDPRGGGELASGTRHHYVASWRLFFKYARRRVPMPNPLEDADWLPSNSAPRSTYWDHPQVLSVLAQMRGQARDAMAIVFGTGMELGAVMALKGGDVGRDKTLVAHGTKNESRAGRTVIVSAWAWVFVPRFTLPNAPLFTITSDAIRDEFYAAQVAAGVIDVPPRSETGGKLWKQVRPHTIHDARHTYAITKALGLDGEPRQSVKYVAHQLGHADEQMVLRIYGKTNVEERARLLDISPTTTRAAR